MVTAQLASVEYGRPVDRTRLAALSVFEGLPEHELDAVAAVASEHEVAAGDTLITEGDFGHSLFVIEHGSADVLVAGDTVRSVGPGDVVGEIAVLASGRRTASVVATSHVRAIALFKRDVWALERGGAETVQRLRAAVQEHVGPAADPPSPA